MNQIPSTPVIVGKYHEFLKWLLPRVAKYPRAHRYTLGKHVEDKAIRIWEGLLRASYSKADKLRILEQVNLELEILRHALRLCHDLQLSNVKQYRYAAECLLEIGQQLGGWIRQQQRKTVARP